MPDGPWNTYQSDDNLDQHYDAAGKQYNVDPDLLRAVHGVEDPHDDPNAVSPQGARGWMQFLPATAREMGVTDTSSPRQSIYGAARYLRQMTDTFGGNRDMGVAAYHGGPDTTNWGPRTSAYLDSVSRGYAERKARRLQAPDVQDKAQAGPWTQYPSAAPAAQRPPWETYQPPSLIPETGGRPLSNRRAVIDLPMAQTEGQPAAPPAVGPGQGTFGGKGTIDPLSGAELPPPGTSSDLGQPRTAAATEAIRARGADTSLDRVLGAAKEAWNNTEFLTPMAQEWADKHGLGGDARVVGTALAAFNAAFQGGVQAAYETARGLGLPDTLARDIGGMAESLGMTGAPHGAMPHDVTRAPPEPVASPTIRQGVADMESAARGEPAPAAAPPPTPEQPPAAPAPVAELQSIARGAPPSGSALPTLQAMAAEAKPWDQTPPAERAEIAKKAGVDPTVANWPMESLSPETQAALQASMTPPPPSPPGAPAQPPALPPARFEPPPPSPPGRPTETQQGTTRLYRIGPTPAEAEQMRATRNVPDWLQDATRLSGADAASGRWFTHDPAEAEWYAREHPNGTVRYVDVPTADLERYRAINQPGAKDFTSRPEHDFFLPPEIANKAQAAALPEPVAPPPQEAAPASPGAEAPYVMLNPEQLTLDPKRFQYKEADEQGRTGALAGTARWEPDLAQPITAWQGNDGNTYVVNGHQRTNRALQAKAEGQPDVQVPTRIYREADGFTPDYMRVLGAYQNIAEGSGTAMDAARILRSNVAIPEDRALPDLPPKSAMVQQGRSLAKLSDEAFGMVSNGLVPEGFAAHVGDLISDPREQMAALEVLSRAQPANSTQARIMVEDVRNSGFAKGTEAGLFGEEAFAKSLIPERARVLDTAMRVLRRGRGLFRAAVEGEETLTGAGNVLDTARNVAAKSANERLLDILDKNATTRGPVSDALSAAARELADGHAAGAVASRFLAAVREIERRTAQDGVRPRATAGGAGSPGAQGEGAAGVEQGQFARRPLEDPEVERQWQALLARGEQQKREADAYAAQGKPARFFDPRYNLTYLISRDLNHPPSGWRQTFFRDGQPTGHEEYNTASEAFLSVLRNGDAVQRIGPNHIEPEPPPQFARRPPRPQSSGAPLFGEPERERQDKPPAEPTIRTDPRQVDMFGKADAAVQAQAARDQAGRGALAPKTPQAKADEGLFATPDEQPSMFSRRDPTETPEFKRWFGASKIVDADGKPLRVYHGTADSFETFEHDRPNRKDAGWLGRGFYFWNAPDLAGDYATMKAGERPNIMPVYLKIKNPYQATIADKERLMLASRRNPAATAQATEELRAKGYDGIILPYSHGDGGLSEIVAFDPEQIKSAIGNRGTFDPNDSRIQFSRREEPPRVPLYSAVERATDALKQAKGSGQQMLAMLQKTPGVKPEEIKWLGLDDFLRNRPSVTKAEIQDYVRANSLDVREVVKGDFTPGSPEAWAQQNSYALGTLTKREDVAPWRKYNPSTDEGFGDISDDRVWQAVQSARENVAREPTKFGTYSLPGGENYREMLITLPVKGIDQSALDAQIRGLLKDWPNDIKTARDPAEQPRLDALLAKWEKNQRKVETQFTSAHWDEPNVLAHIRFDERTAPDGKRVLLMDEAQSDWHQTGRKRGYLGSASKDLPDDVKLRPVQRSMGWVIADHAGVVENDRYYPDEAAAAAAADAANERLAAHDRVPDAPFKTTWPQLTMKRIIKWAVDNGFDRVAWTPGEVQAARYDLSKQISKLALQERPNGSHYLTATDHSGRKVIERPIADPAKELPDLIGKEASDRLLRQEHQTLRQLPRVRQFDLEVQDRPQDWRVTAPDGRAVEIGKQTVSTEEDARAYATKYLNDRAEEINKKRRDIGSTRELSGLDLKVGGEGMKGFYDRMLPTETQKIVGKFGSKVGRSEISYENPHYDTADLGDGRNTGDPDITQPVHSFDISPELRRAVQTEGLPLFAKRAGEESPREIDAEARARLATAAQRIMREAGLPPSVGLRLVDRIAAGDGTADGKYTRSMIELALDTPPEQIAGKLFHEVVHGLTDTRLGLLRPGERAVLYRAADRWLERDGNRASLERAGYGQAELRDEAVARMGEDALKRGLQPPEPYNRMTRFIERTGSLLRGEGFRTADDVFDSVLRGEKRQTAQEGAGPGAEGFARRPVAGPPATTTTPAGPIQRTADAVLHAAKEVTRSIADGLAPMQGGSGRAQAFAGTFANALRKVQYRFGQIDKEIERNFTADERRTMGTKLDAQSAFEQQVRDLPPDQQAAARTQFDASGDGLASLPANQRQVIDMLDRISQDTWRQMQERGMVDPNARGLPYYFPRQILRWTEAEGFTRPGGAGAGTGRGLDERGRNLTTAGPMERKHLTAEETEAAAKAKLGQDVAILRDIRSLPARLAFSHRAMAGVDLMNAIERVGKDTGVDLVVRGDIPGMLQPGEFFTMADHPSFRRWTGSGWQAIHVAKEFEGPLKAVLTKPSPTWYRAAQGLKGGVMTSIMFSPFIHLAVELGRSLPVMPLKVLTLQALRDGSRLRRDLGYMDQATTDGLAPLGQGWHVDPVSIADQANVEGRNGFVRALTGMRDAVANGAKTIGGQFLHDVVQHPHQALLWDQVFNLQVGIYDTMRQRYIDKGFAPEVAGTMAAHIANRYAGALPPEHLGRAANMAANLLLFSRSFTLGNLGVMKDMLSGAPSHIRSRIEQMAGPDVAKSAQSAMRNKAIAAFTMDIGLFYLANGVLQAGLQVLRQTPTLGLPAAAQQTYQDWIDKAGSAVSGMADNPLSIFGVLPQHWNEPGKQDRVYAGTDSQGRAIYLRLPPGKVGEEFVGWFSRPGTMIENKLSPLVRPIIESIFGKDTLGRDIYKPNPETLGDHLRIAGAVVKHIGEGLGPTAFIQGLSEMMHQHILGEKTQADPYVSAMKILGPLTGAAQISQGFPGGQAAGEMHAQTEREKYDLQKALPDIRDKIRKGDVDGAIADMRELRVPPGLMRYYIRQTMHPGPSAGTLRRLPGEPAGIRERVERQMGTQP